MSTLRLLTVGLAIAGIAAAVGYAQPGGEEGRRGPDRGPRFGDDRGGPPRPPAPEQIFGEIDTDGDGMISRDEFMQHHEERMQHGHMPPGRPPEFGRRGGDEGRFSDRRFGRDSLAQRGFGGDQFRGDSGDRGPGRGRGFGPPPRDGERGFGPPPGPPGPPPFAGEGRRGPRGPEGRGREAGGREGRGPRGQQGGGCEDGERRGPSRGERGFSDGDRGFRGPPPGGRPPRGGEERRRPRREREQPESDRPELEEETAIETLSDEAVDAAV